MDNDRIINISFLWLFHSCVPSWVRLLYILRDLFCAITTLDTRLRSIQARCGYLTRRSRATQRE